MTIEEQLRNLATEWKLEATRISEGSDEDVDNLNNAFHQGKARGHVEMLESCANALHELVDRLTL